MLLDADTLDELRDRFRREIPARYDIGRDVCDRWAEVDPGRTALILDEEDRHVSFDELRGLSNRLANLLASRGVTSGDRIGPGEVPSARDRERVEQEHQCREDAREPELDAQA